MTNANCPVSEAPHPETVARLKKHGIEAQKVTDTLKVKDFWLDPSLGPTLAARQHSIEEAIGKAESKLGQDLKVAFVDAPRLKPAEIRDLAQTIQDVSCGDTVIVMTPRWGTSVSTIYPRAVLEKNHKMLHGKLSAEGVDGFLAAVDRGSVPAEGFSAGLLGVAILTAVIVGAFARKSRQ